MVFDSALSGAAFLLGRALFALVVGYLYSRRESRRLRRA